MAASPSSQAFSHKPAEVLAAEESVKTVDPEFVATAVLERLPHNPFLIIPSRDGRLAERLNRYVPAVVDRAIRRPAPSKRGIS